jgi:hypothetical protein
MLRCNMNRLSQKLRLGLEDLLGDLWHARRAGDLGRLAWVSYYEVRRWARLAGAKTLAEHAEVVVSGCPYANRASFLDEVDRLIAELEQALAEDGSPADDPPAALAGGEHAVGAGGLRPPGTELVAARH